MIFPRILYSPRSRPQDCSALLQFDWSRRSWLVKSWRSKALFACMLCMTGTVETDWCLPQHRSLTVRGISGAFCPWLTPVRIFERPPWQTKPLNAHQFNCRTRSVRAFYFITPISKAIHVNPRDLVCFEVIAHSSIEDRYAGVSNTKAALELSPSKARWKRSPLSQQV